MELKELYALAQSSETKLDTCEIYQPNDFYGNATILKQFAGLSADYRIKAAIEHGPMLSDFAWSLDLDAPLPGLLITNSARYADLRHRTNKALFAVGPLIHYAPHFLSEEELDAERKRLGRSLLVFPAHSSHWVNMRYSIEEYCNLLTQITARFDTVRICLYWKDILLGYSEEFMRSGFECVTAGHMFDPRFLPRLKSIIAVSSAATSNEIGSYIGFCVFMGKPFSLTRTKLIMEDENSVSPIRDGIDPQRESKPWFNEICGAFAGFQEDVTAGQRSIVDRYWGLGDIKSRAELRAILETTEDMYRARLFASGRNALIAQIEHYMQAGKKARAEYLLKHAEKVYERSFAHVYADYSGTSSLESGEPVHAPILNKYRLDNVTPLLRNVVHRLRRVWKTAMSFGSRPSP